MEDFTSAAVTNPILVVGFKINQLKKSKFQPWPRLTRVVVGAATQESSALFMT